MTRGRRGIARNDARHDRRPLARTRRHADQGLLVRHLDGRREVCICFYAQQREGEEQGAAGARGRSARRRHRRRHDPAGRSAHRTASNACLTRMDEQGKLAGLWQGPVHASHGIWPHKVATAANEGVPGCAHCAHHKMQDQSLARALQRHMAMFSPVFQEGAACAGCVYGQSTSLCREWKEGLHHDPTHREHVLFQRNHALPLPLHSSGMRTSPISATTAASRPDRRHGMARTGALPVAPPYVGVQTRLCFKCFAGGHQTTLMQNLPASLAAAAHDGGCIPSITAPHSLRNDSDRALPWAAVKHQRCCVGPCKQCRLGAWPTFGAAACRMPVCPLANRAAISSKTFVLHACCCKERRLTATSAAQWCSCSTPPRPLPLARPWLPAPSRGHIAACASHRHLHLDGLVRRVALQLEILHAKAVDVGDRGVDAQAREGTGRVAQLLPQRRHVVCIHVGVTQHMHKVAGAQPAHLRRE